MIDRVCWSLSVSEQCVEFINQIPYFSVIKLDVYSRADHFEVYHATHDNNQLPTSAPTNYATML
jgi:hypothetical protein